MGGLSAPTRELCPPEHIGPEHDVSQFSNGSHATLDHWLRQRALTVEGLTARTYVVCPRSSPGQVVAYHCILASMAERLVLPSARLRKGTPEDVPLFLIGRLAVDRVWQGRGVGSAMLVDAVNRCLAATKIIGARAIVAHALDDAAVAFYQRHDFLLSTLGERVMVLPMEAAKSLVAYRD